MEALLLTVPEAARLLGISRSKAYELLANGEIHSVQIGTCRRIRQDWLAGYVDRLSTHSDGHTRCAEGA
jgi:excisionase family DNA binding protein